MSSELFTLTYGALVVDLLRDLESPEEVNRQLDKIGFNIGLRIADDFLSKNLSVGRCKDMHEVSEIISKNALKTYLGTQELRPMIYRYNGASDLVEHKWRWVFLGTRLESTR